MRRNALGLAPPARLGPRPRAAAPPAARALLGAAAAAAVLAGAAQAARADAVDDAHRKLNEIDERARRVAAEFRESAPPDPHAPERRVLEAETLFRLKNYFEAATICVDVMEKYPNSRAYDDAVYLAGESLYQDNDLLSARRYFELAAKKGSGSRKEQAALQRMVEIALKTDDYTGVEDVFEKLAKIPPAQLEPSVPYVRGKYLFFRDKLDDALLAFSQVAPTNPYYMQSRYFVATVQIKKGDLAAALAGFDEVLRVQPRSDGEKEIQDLARLAIGRLHYQRGQFDKARDAYAQVPRQSKHFIDAMFESAWNAIKANDFKSAYRALDLMLLQTPDSPQAPELRLLMGNLHLRMSNFYLASEQFSQTLGEYEPIYKDLKLTQDRAATDPKFFDNLLSKGLDKFDIASVFPKGAIKLVVAETDVARLLALADEVGELTRGIRESEQLLGRLERAVHGGARAGVFPDLASARARSTEVLNQTVVIRRRFGNEARNLANQYLSPQDKAALDQIAAERQGLDEHIQNLPTSTDQLKDRALAVRGQFSDLDGRASEINVLIQALEAELVAIEQYFITSKADQKIRPDDLKQPVADLRQEIGEMRAQLDKIRNEIVETGQEAGLAGTAGGDRGPTLRFTELLKREQEILRRARGGMSGGAAAELDRYLEVLARCDAIQGRLVEFDGRLDTVADRRLQGIREQLSSEKTQLAAANSKLGSILGESQTVGGGLAQAMLGKVTDRFYDLTVQSDVGLIDVSWGLKEDKSTNLGKLINQQKLELKALDDDFRALLKDTEEEQKK
jgi:tetratricopeptide (TPR) repeat protein